MCIRDRDGGVPVAQTGEHAAHGINAQGQRSDIQQQDILHVAGEHALSLIHICSGFGGFDGFGDLGDIFGEFFGGGRSRGSQQNASCLLYTSRRRNSPWAYRYSRWK